ncbi:nitroreductase [Streptomyces sp. NPDC051940]|uniref:Acg family FMN-binding oxidoreductase n=1 Tax=Streptomyces sp. NPDC051940 TaxID=3155675 RepID=UPI00343AD425
MPTLDEKTVTSLVADATAAPSMHNAQPWRFRYDADSRTLELRADPERSLVKEDPDDRALHLGCGAALLNLRVSAAHSGFEPRVELLPDPRDPLLLARVTLGTAVAGTPDAIGLPPLYLEIARRHTSRQPFSDREVPAPVRTGLSEAAALEGARLAFPPPWHTDALLSVIDDAEHRHEDDAERRAEQLGWTRTGEGGTEGIPDSALGPSRRGGRAPVRGFAGERLGSADYESEPQLALLGTAHDTPADWLRAGQALERVLLLATRHGLATALTSVALEWEDLRWLATDPVRPMGHVQMVLRLGYGPAGAGTPRRPVDEVLEGL